MNHGALIITAGNKARPEKFQPTQKIGSISVTQRLIMTFHLAEIRPIAVITTPDNYQELEKYTNHPDVILLTGDEDTEMFGHILLGLDKLKTECERIFITPVDIPLFSVETLKQMMQSESKLAAPFCQGKAGHPLMLHHSLIPVIAQYQGTDGLRGAVRSCGFNRDQIEVEDSGVYIRSDQFSECESMLVSHNQKEWQPVMKLQVAKETPFLGPGSWQLLSLIETTGSVRLASGQMGISYSKAWKILNNLEEQLGYYVLDRRQGGRAGGETHMTKQGRALLQWFENYERECSRAVHEIFERHYEQLNQIPIKLLREEGAIN